MKKPKNSGFFRIEKIYFLVIILLFILASFLIYQISQAFTGPGTCTAPNCNGALSASGSNVGIGTTTPTYPLDVVGSIRISSTSTNNPTIYLGGGSSPYQSFWLASGSLYLANPNKIYFQSPSGTTILSVGPASGSNGITVANTPLVSGDVASKGYVDSAIPATYWAASSTNIYNTNSGNVGIGTTTPSTALTVQGNISLPQNQTVLLGSTATKQVSGGPELITSMNSVSNHVVMWSGIPSDTYARYIIAINGLNEWGAGGSSDQDIALFRNSAGNLTVQSFNTGSTNTFQVNTSSTGTGTEVLGVDTINLDVRAKQLWVNGAAGGATLDVAGTSGKTAFRVMHATAGDTSFSTAVNGDSFLRFSFLANGTMTWGPGTATSDVQFYRPTTSALAMIGTGTPNSINVGIGTTTPGYNLAVVGNIYATGNISCGGTCGGGSVSAANVSNGQFGQLVGGGNYSFPASVGIDTTTPLAPLDVEGNVMVGYAAAKTIFLGTASSSKQISYGPEAITFSQPGTTRRVFLWAGQDNAVNARFLMDNQGFLEWGQGGSSDQDSSFSRSQSDGRMYLLNPYGFVVGTPSLANTLVDINNSTSNPSYVMAINKPVGSGVGTLDVLAVTSSQPTIRAGELTSGSNAFASYVSGDAQLRYTINSGGTMTWGPGSTAADVSFFRNAAGSLLVQGLNNISSTAAFAVLKPTGGTVFNIDTVNSRVGIGSSISIPSSATLDVTGNANGNGLAAIRASQPLAGDLAFGAFVAGDAQLRYVITANGNMQWGPGTATADVQIYRPASAQLALIGVSSPSTISVGIGTTNPSLGKLQVENGDIYTTGGTDFYAVGDTGARNAFYRGGTDIQILRNYNTPALYGTGYTVLDVWSPPGAVTSTAASEATLSLVRGNEPYQQFMDVYNINTQMGIRIARSTSTNGLVYQNFIISQYNSATRVDDLTFANFNSSGNIYFLPNGGGQVAIGTSTPSQVLTVQGNIYATGNISCGGSCGGGTPSAANVSNGQFGSNVGGGIYSFPTSVGVGTTTPQQLLHLFQTSTATYLRVEGGNDGSNFAGLELRSYETTPNMWQFVQTNTHAFKFAYYNGTGWSTPFIILPTGQTGINQTGPSATLDIKSLSSSYPVIRTTALLAADNVFGTFVNGDAQLGFLIGSRGALQWGSGSSGADIELTRNATSSLLVYGMGSNSTTAFGVYTSWGGAEVLGVDTTNKYVRIAGASGGAVLDVNNAGTWPPTVRASDSAASGVAYAAFVNGDAQLRYTVNADGTIEWGPGSATADVMLYRAAASSLTFGGVSSLNNIKIGIGTSTPVQVLHVYQSNTAAYLRVEGANDGSNFAGLELRSVEATPQMWQFVQRNDHAFKFAYYNGSGWSTPFIILSSGNVGISTSTPATALQVYGDIRVGNSGTNGCVQNFGGGVLVGTCTSDVRLKKDITPLTGVLDKLTELQPSWYYWNASAYPSYHFGSDRQLGLVAQNVQKIFPELVSTNSEGYEEVNYSAIPLYTLEAVKELKQQNDALSAQNASLEARVRVLEQRLGITP